MVELPFNNEPANTSEIPEKKKISKAKDPAIVKSKQCNFKVVTSKFENYQKKAEELDITNFSFFLETMCDRGIIADGSISNTAVVKQAPEIDKVKEVEVIKEVEKIVYKDGIIFSAGFNTELAKRIASGKSKDKAHFIEQCFKAFKDVNW